VLYPDIDLARETPFYCVDFVCGETGCGLHTRVYIRDTAVLPRASAIAYAKEALGDIDAMCASGRHFLSKAETQVSFRKVLELE